MDVLEELRQSLGPEAVLVGEEVALRGNGWGRRDPCRARALVRPRDTAELARVLRACHRAGQPVVIHGGMTGLVAGAVARPEEIALSLERMTAIEEVDPVGRTMTVQAGVALEAIQRAAEEAGCLFPLDLGARGSCTIGGNAATNAGGNQVLRYGMTRAQILGLEAVLADGTVIDDLRKMLKNNAGYDLKQLFIGAEGTLGVVTRLVLRLRARPRSENTALVAVDSFAGVTRLLGASEEHLGGDLTAFEVMWEDFYRTVTTEPAKGRPPLAYGHPYYAIVEMLGSHPESDATRFEGLLAEAVEQGWAADAALAGSRAERRALWALRDDVEQLGRYAPIFTFDVGVPISRMESYVAEVRSGLAEEFPDLEVVCIVFGHLGDGNLHPTVGVGDSSPETRRRVERRVYGPLRERGGSVSAEHGIGLEKQPYLSWSRGAAEIELMRTLKSALDPQGILNPGRVIPPAGES
ncbi:MAG TPA: FAD-binding oxidoreductase [Thermoanaerobaculia bacterium]|nr:FAD-binding oxidoreductase [Thermoanaerobaculia bacterium]